MANLEERRITRLISEGFLPQEADWYAKLGKISDPGMRRTRRFRITEIRKATQAGITDIPSYIRESYAAQGFISEDGSLQLPNWNARVFWEIEKPAHKREPIAIAPSFFNRYSKARKRFSSADAYRISSRIPRDEFDQRMRQYQTLKRAHFLDWECIKIITTRAKPDITGKRVLQSLDLTSDGWKQAMAARTNFYEERFNEYKRKRYPSRRAHSLAMADIQKTYVGSTGDTRQDQTVWSFLREIYKIDSTSEKTPEEFQRLLALWKQEFARKKMPYRVKRRK